MKPMPVNGSRKEKTQIPVPNRPANSNGNASQKVLWGKDQAVGRLGGDLDVARGLALGGLGAVEALQASAALEQMGHEKNLSEAAAVFASLEGHLADLHRVMKASAGATR